MAFKATQFRLYIKLGDDAMQTPQDVANVLRDLAFDIENQGVLPSGKNLLDDNGNTVGHAHLQH